MTYSLIVDIGNSQIEFGLFSEGKIVNKIYLPTPKFDENYNKKMFAEFIRNSKVEPNQIVGGMIFSVVPHLSKLIQIIIKGEIGVEIPLFNSEQILSKIKMNVEEPKEVGQDILADIYGGIHLYGVPLIVSDLGTVTKNIIIDEKGVFQGVSFFPGVRLNANSLSEKTAQLPQFNNFERPELFFGRNTIDAMRSGIYYYHVSAIKDFMKQCEQYFGQKFKKVITGGYSYLFKKDFLSEQYIVDPDLVLKGMYLICNQK